MIAAFVVQGLTLPLVGKLGGGDDAKGWSLTIAIYAAVAVIFFVITFFSAKERVQPPAGQKPDLKQDVRDLLKSAKDNAHADAVQTALAKAFEHENRYEWAAPAWPTTRRSSSTRIMPRPRKATRVRAASFAP